MSLERDDVDALLEVVADYADRHLSDETVVDLTVRAAESPLPTLGADLVAEGGPDVLPWVIEAVEAVARRSASWGFVLASRYAAQVLVPDGPAGAFLVTGDVTGTAVTLPAVPLAAGDLSAVLVLSEGAVHEVLDAAPTADQQGRTGLAGARLASVTGVLGTARTVDADRAEAVHQLLLGAVASGLSAALLRVAARYTNEREQFGAPIATFAGLRAVLATAHEGSVAARRAVGAAAASLDADDAVVAAAAAADQALWNAIDAVQALGGYGYIDEYPVAVRFRDAVSLRARTAPAHRSWRAAARSVYRQLEER